MTEFFVVMVKREDGEVYADLHKTDGKFYLVEEEARRALEDRGRIAKHFHVVRLYAELPELYPSKDDRIDDLFWDATDGAHPAWWRGNDRGVQGACERIQKVLHPEAPIDPNPGKALNSLCSEVGQMKDRIQNLETELRDRAKYGSKWCDRCALYYHQAVCPECELDSLGTMFRKYATHTNACQGAFGHDCDCGFDELQGIPRLRKETT
jgi:hypothetical protein